MATSGPSDPIFTTHNMRGQLAVYSIYLQKRSGLSANTKQAYEACLRRFASFLNETGQLPLPVAEADNAAREFRKYLKNVRKQKPATINLHLAALDSFFQVMGLQKHSAKREDLPDIAPQALSQKEQDRLLRMLESYGSPKEQALIKLLLYTAIRIGECTAIDLDDVQISDRKGLLVVRSGKGDRYREIPLNSDLRATIKLWLTERAKQLQRHQKESQALFINPSCYRISSSGVDMVVRKYASMVGVRMSAHTLRHSCLTNLIRRGNDLVLVAEIAGHRRLDTTRKYTRPSANDKQLAMEKLLD